jgi:hypothetical protein
MRIGSAVYTVTDLPIGVMVRRVTIKEKVTVESEIGEETTFLCSDDNRYKEPNVVEGEYYLKDTIIERLRQQAEILTLKSVEPTVEKIDPYDIPF